MSQLVSPRATLRRFVFVSIFVLIGGISWLIFVLWSLTDLSVFMDKLAKAITS